MLFHSILYKKLNFAGKEETTKAPDFFSDLKLDLIIDRITIGRQSFNLNPFFYESLKDIDEIQYRHEIMQDLENMILFNSVQSFIQKMAAMKKKLIQTEKSYYLYQKESWFLDTVDIYCEAIQTLAQDLASMALHSQGFIAFREYVTTYIQSKAFTTILEETKNLIKNLAQVQYSLLLRGNCIQVRCYQDEPDYSVQVEKTFHKFKQTPTKDYKTIFSETPDMNHIEAKILDLVVQLHPQVFSQLDNYYSTHATYLDEKINRFYREVQFYMAYLEYMERFKGLGLSFCYPIISNSSKEVYSHGSFDLALANNLIEEKASIVCNDFYLKDKERIFVISGPNQGGKTTFARTFGQLHYLASIGCPVPGKTAGLFLFDKLFTHFEREEDIKNLSGKLQDDLLRIHTILNNATSNSIVIMNEIFTSTALKDAHFLGKKVMEKIIELDLLCIYVTFVDELASLGETTVSLMSTIIPENPSQRTYKIIRKPADGLSYAQTIAEKYNLTYSLLKERIKQCKLF